MWHTMKNNDCGRFTYSPGQAGESSQTFCLDTHLSELAKSNPTQELSYYKDNEMESCQSSQSGTMSEPSTEDLGVDQLMFFAEDSPVRTSVRQVKERELPESVRGYGRSMRDSLKRCGLNMSLPKTLHAFALEDLELSSKIWPRWGIMLDGECSELGMSVRRIKETESGYLATPMRSDYKHYSANQDYHRRRVARSIDFPSHIAVNFGTHGKIHPNCSEIAMMWPAGWTDLKPLVTDKFQKWQNLHGKY